MIKSLKQNIKTNQVWLSCFLIAVLLTHLPFFIYLPIPNFSMDTFGYFWFAQEIDVGSLPIHLPAVDFPIGYSLFIYALKKLGINALGIVITQTLIFLIAGIYFIHSAFKFGKVIGISAAIALIIFVFIPYTLRYNFTLYTESLYTSLLLALCASILSYYHRKKTINFLLVALFVLLGLTTRSNGVILLFVPILIVIEDFIFKNKAWKIKVVFFLAIIVFPQLMMNFLFKGELSFSESKRITTVFKKLLEDKPSMKIIDWKGDPIIFEKDSKTDMYQSYFFNFINRKPSYYFSLLPTFYEQQVVKQKFKSTNQTMFNMQYNVDLFAPNLKKYIVQGVDYSSYNKNEYKKQIDYESTSKNKWMMVTHLFYEGFNYSLLFYVIYLFFWIAIILLLLKKWFMTKLQKPLLIIACIHIFSMLILPLVHIRFQARYIQVSEFIVLFIGVYLILSLTSKLYFFKKTKKIRFNKTISDAPK